MSTPTKADLDAAVVVFETAVDDMTAKVGAKATADQSAALAATAATAAGADLDQSKAAVSAAKDALVAMANALASG